MVKSYMELIGIFRGKQATHNIQILKLLWEDGPLTAWEIAGKISPRSRISLHATLNKRLRSLESKEYVKRANKKWCLQFKGMIAAILIQKTPTPMNIKLSGVIENYAKHLEDNYEALSRMTIQVDGMAIHPLEMIKQTGPKLRTFDDWVGLSKYVKELIQKGVVNLDAISNETLLAVIITETPHEQLEDEMKNWNIQNTDSNKMSLSALLSTLNMIDWPTTKTNRKQQHTNATAPTDHKLTSRQIKTKAKNDEPTTKSSKT